MIASANMTEQKNFTYTANVKFNKPKLDTSDIEIQEVVFLTPARIVALVEGIEKTFMASVDIINKKVYVGDNDTSLSELVFGHLDNINSLPEDFFSAPDEIEQEAIKAEEDRERVFKETIGATNE
jgi:hypothetical protein